MHIVIQLKERGVHRVLGGRPGLTFIVNHFTQQPHSNDQIAHVRDYRYPDETLGRSYQIWSIGPEGYEVILT